MPCGRRQLNQVTAKIATRVPAEQSGKAIGRAVGARTDSQAGRSVGRSVGRSGSAAAMHCQKKKKIHEKRSEGSEK